jgi:hypothetical protein
MTKDKDKTAHDLEVEREHARRRRANSFPANDAPRCFHCQTPLSQVGGDCYSLCPACDGD